MNNKSETIIHKEMVGKLQIIATKKNAKKFWENF